MLEHDVGKTAAAPFAFRHRSFERFDERTTSVAWFTALIAAFEKRKRQRLLTTTDLQQHRTGPRDSQSTCPLVQLSTRPMAVLNELTLQ